MLVALAPLLSRGAATTGLMPEGDSIASDAIRLGAVLEKQTIEAVYATAASVRKHSGRIVGSTVARVRSVGKNLIVDFDTGYSLRVHLAMNGRWIVLGVGDPVPGAAKVALTTHEYHAVCLAAPTVEVDRKGAIERTLESLGPDLLDKSVDISEVVARARNLDSEPLGRVLLNQRIAAGIGNVYKSELAFLIGVHPHTILSELTDDQMRAIYERASRLLTVNVRRGRRITTGNRSPGGETWVYGREGKACRRCSTRIAAGRLDHRVSYWCPTCQVGPS